MTEVKEYLKQNWKNVVLILFSAYTLASVIFGWNGYSLVVGFKSGSANAKIEFNDMDLDTTDDMELYDLATFVPKPPKYFVIHCTASLKDQTADDLRRIARERFNNGRQLYNYSINFKGEVYSLAPIDNSKFIEYNEIVNGVRNMNSVCISVSITGNRDENKITPEQLNTLRYMYLRFKQQFPDLILTTHRELASVDLNKNGRIDEGERIKQCPRFDVNDYFF